MPTNDRLSLLIFLLQIIWFLIILNVQKCFTVDDLNLALSLNGFDEIYGLCPRSLTNSLLTGTVPSSSDSLINLMDYANLNGSNVTNIPTLPRIPLSPELSLHWLAVDGVQPLIPENPLPIGNEDNILDSANNDNLSSGTGIGDNLMLPNELRHFFKRTTGLLLAGEQDGLSAVFIALRSDIGLQELVPYYSK